MRALPRELPARCPDSRASNSATGTPRRASTRAVAAPISPAPTTATSISIVPSVTRCRRLRQYEHLAPARECETSGLLDRLAERVEDLPPARLVPTTDAGRGGQLLLGKPFPAPVFQLHPGHRRPERTEAQLDLGDSGQDLPRHREPRRRLPGDHTAPVDLVPVVPDLVDAPVEARLEHHVRHPGLPHREGPRRPPLPDRAHERVEGVRDVATDHDPLADRRALPSPHPLGFPHKILSGSALERGAGPPPTSGLSRAAPAAPGHADAGVRDAARPGQPAAAVSS